MFLFMLYLFPHDCKNTLILRVPSIRSKPLRANSSHFSRNRSEPLWADQYYFIGYQHVGNFGFWYEAALNRSKPLWAIQEIFRIFKSKVQK